MANTLMVQGTTSDAGKSVLVAGLCRVLARRGVKVAPMKPQNMALNSAVTVDGGEIGRAQAVQSQACFIEPHTDMNPVLLKPSSDTGAQVIIHGHALSNMQAAAFHDYKKNAMQAVLQSHQRLEQQYDAVVVEGAGSPAEINLRENDIANMGFAEAVDCPVIIVADIDRGGVFAHLVGTLDLLSKTEQQRVVGFVINRFRGDITLLQSGLDWLEQRTGKPVLAVLPYLQNFYLDSEDAVDTQQVLNGDDLQLKVVVPVYPRTSNHTDFDALRQHPRVDLIMVRPGAELPAADLIILPGSKNVQADLQSLRSFGWGAAIAKHLRYGGKVLGICGGLQMLGQSIADPHAIESDMASSIGLSYLPVKTVLEESKQLRKVQGVLSWGAVVKGYEIHCGVSRRISGEPFAMLEDGREDGVISKDCNVAGTYLHGLFDCPESADAILRWAGLAVAASVDLDQQREQQLERLADCIEQHFDANFLSELCEDAHSSRVGAC